MMRCFLFAVTALGSAMFAAGIHADAHSRNNVRLRHNRLRGRTRIQHRPTHRVKPRTSSRRRISHSIREQARQMLLRNHEVAFVNATGTKLESYGSQSDQVREALHHLWSGYRTRAWGKDEVRPISGEPGGKWGNIGMAILDTLDTLWLAGMHKEFAEGEQWVAAMKFDGPARYRTSFFETTIRALAGLLSSYALSGHSVFLEKARELGSRLLHAFPNRDHPKSEFVGHWPAAYLDIRNPTDTEVAPSWLGQTILADAGSNILEFSYLAEATGDARFKSAADANELELLDLAAKTKHHLAPKFLNPYSHSYSTDDVSVGAFADSYFEYLLKAYIQSRGTEKRLLKEWKQSMEQMRKSLVSTSKGGFTFVKTSKRGQTMDHLSCFIGGLLALGSHVVPKADAEDWWLPVGAEITRTCYEMYRASPSGLAPEVVSVREKVEPVEHGYRLRPETLESLFYLHRITGNETYRQWSWEIFQAINKHTRTQWGFANARDVMRVPVALEDTEETFMGAETLKYALLIHLPASALPLDQYVLNTEAHPLPSFQPVDGHYLPPAVVEL